MGRLQIEGIRYRDRGPFDLAVEAGCCTTLTGPSGGGKTLLLRAIADLDPHEGRVALDGEESRTVPAPLWRRWVAMLPTDSAWWCDTVGGHFAGGDGTLLAAVGFDRGVLDWSVARLSSGERQRLALVRLLLNRPRALLLDEPTASLDADSAARVERVVADYRASTGAPVLWVCHDAAQARRVADRTLALRDGTLSECPR